MRPRFLALVFFLGSSIPLMAATYYVSPAGSDSWPGTEAQPWATIQHAADELLPGDTVFVKAGAYYEQVVPANSGTALNGITYAVYPGDTATINGQGITVPQYSGLFDLSGRSYITVSGFRVVNSNEAGILGDNSGYLTIQNNYTYNTGTSGISVWGCHHILIENNEVERACTGLYQESISVSGTDVFEVKNNIVHDVGPGNKEGICIKDGSTNGSVHGNIVWNTLLGIYVDAETITTSGIQVYGNITHDNTHDGIALATEQGALLDGISVFNNISYQNGWNGLDISACCTSNHPMSNIRIANNTFYSNGYGALDWGQGIYVENPDITGLDIFNNICSQNNSYQIALDYNPSPSDLIDYNLIDGPAETYYGTNNVIADPLFLNPAAADFHLQTSSPARDAGTSTAAPATDFEGNPRPQGSGFDIGAYEYTSGDPDFSVSCNPASLSIAPGESGTTTCTVYSYNSFSSHVDLSCSGEPSGAVCVFTPSAVTPPSNGSVASTLQIDIDAGAAFGVYSIQVVGTGPSTHFAGLSLTIGPPCIFCDEFDDGLEDWSYAKGSWREIAGYLYGQSARKGIAWTPPTFAGCDICSFRSRMQTAGGTGNRVWLLGWYADKYNYVELIMKEEVDRWLLKQHMDGVVVRKLKCIAPIDPGVFHDARISFDGSQFELWVNEAFLCAMPGYPGSMPHGTGGLMLKATTATFDDFRVE